MFLHPRGEKECHLLNHFSPSTHYIFAQMNQLVRSLSALSINDAKVLVRSFASKKSEKIEAKKEKEMAAKKRAKLQMMGKGSSGKPVTGKKKEKEAEAAQKKKEKAAERRKTQIERQLINTGMQVVKRGLFKTLFK